jgi:hypothetical protein
VADAARLLAARPVDIPGHELRTADSGWIDLSAASGDALTVTLFPTGAQRLDLAGGWVVAAQPAQPYRYQRLDRNGQCHIRGLRAGQWAVRLLSPDRSWPALGNVPLPTGGSPPRPDFGRLLGAVSDDDPIMCCEALDALRMLADGEVWPAEQVEPVVRQLRENPEAIVRRAAAEVLGEVGGIGAVPPLLAAADDPMWSVQYAAVVSLGLVADATAAGRLGEISHDLDRDPAVREAAQEALDRLGESVDELAFVPQRLQPTLPVPDAALIAPVAAGRFPAIDPGVAAVVEQDDVALLMHPDPFDADTVVLAVAPGDAVAGYIASLWAVGSVRVHSGVFDRLGQLQLRSVRPDLRYALRIHPPGQIAYAAVRELAAAIATPVLVRGKSGPVGPELVVLLELSDPDGRTMTIYRLPDNTIVADVVGLGITDRRLVVRLPIEVGDEPMHLLAPLRWNHTTDRCEARLVVHATDRLDANGWLEIHRADELGPEFADAVTASIHRARGVTVDAWVALAADPSLYRRIASVIRGALGRSSTADTEGSG